MLTSSVIAIAADHAGYKLKEVLKGYLEEKGYTVKDFGTRSLESVDYPDFVHPLAEDILSGGSACGIIICGSGNGVNITANRHKGIRSALCWLPQIASLAKQHNNANVIALPARYIAAEFACEIVDAYLSASFEGGRHQKRVDKIEC